MSATTPLVPVTIQLSTGTAQVLGEVTANPHLLLTPMLSRDGRYTGTFSITHVPTGRQLFQRHDFIGAEVARRVAELVADQDWSSADPAAYAWDTDVGRALKDAMDRVEGWEALR